MSVIAANQLDRKRAERANKTREVWRFGHPTTLMYVLLLAGGPIIIWRFVVAARLAFEDDGTLSFGAGFALCMPLLIPLAFCIWLRKGALGHQMAIDSTARHIELIDKGELVIAALRI